MDSDNLKYFDIIERYCNGEMSECERNKFDNELLHNDELKEEFEFYSKVIDGIKGFHVSKLKSQFKEIDLQLDSELVKSNKPSIKQIIIYSIAAIFTLLVVSYAVFNLILKNQNLKEIALKYNEEEKGLPVLMSISENSQLNEAMTLYKIKDFQGSLNILQKLLPTNIGNDTLIFYSGINYQMLDSTGNAINCFMEITSLKSSAFIEKAEFRLALCYLKLEDKQKSEEVLRNIIIHPSHLFKEKAIMLLKELK